MCNQTTCEGIPRCICSPGSADGPTPSDLPVGQTTDPFGLAAAPASRSASPEGVPVQMTLGISGPSSAASLRSADLQSRLESKLRAVLAGRGSPLYALTWKSLDMPSGPPICALRASGLRTSGSGSTGWPTAAARDWRDGRSNMHGENARPLNEVAMLAGWPTPDASVFEAVDLERLQERRSECKELAGNGNGFGLTLGQAAPLLTGWNTPRATDGANGGPNQAGGALSADAAMAGNLITGATSNGSPAETGPPGRLNPEFVRWLMGFPAAWEDCADTATQSSRKSRRRS